MEAKSVYRQGADEGVPYGILLVAVSLAFVYSGRHEALSLVALVLLCLLPVRLVVIIRRYNARCGGMAPFSALWMLGIMATGCGSIICAAVTYVVLEYAEPTFLYDQMEAAVEAYSQLSSAPGGEEMYTNLRRALDQGMVPTPIQFVVSMVWLTAFTGSAVSLVIAGVTRAMSNKR